MEDIVNLIVNNGVAVAVVAFYMVRDLKYTQALQTSLTTLIDTVNSLKEIIRKEEKE